MCLTPNLSTRAYRITIRQSLAHSIPWSIRGGSFLFVLQINLTVPPMTPRSVIDETVAAVESMLEKDYDCSSVKTKTNILKSEC